MQEEALLEKIISRIRVEQKIIAIKRKIAVFGFCLTVSLVGFGLTTKSIYLSLDMAGFDHLFSLLFSDTAVVVSIWQNFTLSLLETLPVNSILIGCALVIGVLGSARFLTRNLLTFKKYEYQYQ